MTNWLNLYGLAIMTVLMIPNIVFGLARKHGFENLWHKKAVEILEQVGRLGCFAFMLFKRPGPEHGFWFDNALYIYLGVNAFLLALYCMTWVRCWHKDSLFRALALSILPSLMFLFSSVITRNLPLLFSALFFVPCHITISVKNAALRQKSKKLRGNPC